MRIGKFIAVVAVIAFCATSALALSGSGGGSGGGGGGGINPIFEHTITESAGAATMVVQGTTAAVDDNTVALNANATITTPTAAQMGTGERLNLHATTSGTAWTVTFSAGVGVTLQDSTLGGSNVSVGASCAPPATGYVDYLFRWDGTNLNLLGCAVQPPAATLPVALQGDTTVMLATGTYNTPAGTNYLLVNLVSGGGGGGGGFEAATPEGGGSGAPGSAIQFLIPSPNSSYSVTIGAGGTVGTCSTGTATAGGAGGSSTFGDYTVNGGGGGGAGSAGTPGTAGAIPSFVNWGLERAISNSRVAGLAGSGANGGGVGNNGFGGGGVGGTATSSSCSSGPAAGLSGVAIVKAIH